MRVAIKAAFTLTGILLGGYLGLSLLGWIVSGFFPAGSLAADGPFFIIGIVGVLILAFVALALILPFVSLMDYFEGKEKEKKEERSE